MTPEEIKDLLRNEIGSECYYQFGIKNLITSGAKNMAEYCGAFWLLSDIFIHSKYINDHFISCELKVENGRGELVLGDGNGKTYSTHEIEFTDFPLDSIKLYLVDDEENRVIMLPTEY